MAETDSNFAPLSRKEKLSYGVGEVAGNLSWNLVAAFLLYYYTDVALLPVAALGTLMLLTRIFDAITDPIVGALVDRTLTRRGRAKPYLFWFAIPFGVLVVLTFSVPEVSPTLKVVYAYVTFLLLGLAYTLLYVPYGALFPMMTRNYSEKAQLSSFRMMGTSIGSIIVYSSAMYIVHTAGGGDDRLGFTIAAIIFGTTSAVLFYVVYYNCTERQGFVEPAPSNRVLPQFRSMFLNPTWRMAMFFGLTNFIRIGLIVSSVAFFAKNILGSTDWVGIILPGLSVSLLAFGYLSGHLLSRFDIRTGVMGACAISVLLYLLLPQLESQPAWLVAVFCLANGSTAIIGTSMFMIMATSVEEHEKLFKQRSEGVLFAGVSFSLKVGMAIGTAAVAYTLGMVEYDPSLVTDEARSAIRMLFYVAPAVMSVIQGLACLKLSRLEGLAKPQENPGS